MKAFMSTGPSHMVAPAIDRYVHLINSTPLHVNVWEVVAEAEARAILRETEPETTHFAGCLQMVPYNVRTLTQGAWRGSLVHNAGAALAESLARFIALDLEA